MKIRILAAVTIGAALLGTCIGVQAQTAPGEKKEIRISERVFLVRDRAGSPVEFQMIVNAGSADEPGGVSRGIAHYLEHLLLVGRNAENADIALRFLPDARSNGWTNQRATAYTHSVPARSDGPGETLEKLFSFYAARLRDFEITPEDAARERNVVLQEHDWRLGSSASTRFSRRLDLALYQRHPFGQWPIGTRESIAGLQVEDARAFHRAWYHINNVWFAIKGDIDPEALRIIVEKHLGGLPVAKLPARASAGPPDIAPHFEHLAEKDAQAATPGVTYRKLFRFAERDGASGRAVATVLSNLLSTQLPGSLYDVIVEQKKFAHTAPGVSLSRVSDGVYQLNISARPAPGVALADLSNALAAYVGNLTNAEFSERNVARIKTRLAGARREADGDSARVYGRLVGWLAAGYPYEELNAFPERFGAVTRDELRALAAAAAGAGRVVSGVLATQESVP